MREIPQTSLVPKLDEMGFGELVAVKQVRLRVPAAEQEKRRAQCGARGRVGGAFGQEAAVRGDPGAGTDHDHRPGGVGGQPERRGGVPDEPVNDLLAALPA